MNQPVADDMNDVTIQVTVGMWREITMRLEALEDKLPKAELELVKPKRTRGSRLPEGYVPPNEKVNQMLSELGCDKGSLIREHRKFCDHFLSAPGQKGVKVDWDRTWCNWMRSASERGNLRGTRQTSPADQKVQDWLALGEAET